MKINKRSIKAMYVITDTHTISIDDSISGETSVSVWENKPGEDRVLYTSINNDLYVDKAHVKEKKEAWYEVAVSYTNDDGTETLERKDSLKDAMQYAKNCSELQNENVDFIFIDRWCYDGSDARLDHTFNAQIINK